VAGNRQLTSSRARAAVATLPRGRASPALAQLAPSRRSLAVGLGLVAIAVGAYWAARQSSAFSVARIEVDGAPAAVRLQVRRAVAPLLGTSLLALDGAALERRLEAVPTVRAAGYDRAFPHTLRIHILPELPVAVLHRGTETWLVSARGRVLSRVPNLTFGALARIWVPSKTALAPGAFLTPEWGGTAARARARAARVPARSAPLALAARFPARIATVSLVQGRLVFRLRSGLVLELGEPTDIRLKLAIARRALAALPPGAAYVDVSVPGRPVAGTNSRLSGRG
jgi:cell division protein FtsQ